MAMPTKMTFPTEDDDDLDVEALRMAALQTLKKPSAPPVHSQGPLPNVSNNVGGLRVVPHKGPRPNQNRGRGRGVMRGRGRGRGNFQGNFHNSNNQNFFPSRPSGNSNLITIVPTIPDEPGTPKDTQQQGSHLAVGSGNVAADSTLNEEGKVPAKFRRLDDDSDSEESDDDPGLKLGSDIESSGDEDDEKENEKSENSVAESDKEELVALQHEGDNSLERLMRELEEEISDTPKDQKQIAPSTTKDKPKIEKVPKVKKMKKERPEREQQVKEAAIIDDDTGSVTSSDKLHGSTNQCTDLKSNDRRSPTPQETQVFRKKSKSPQSYEPVARDPSPRRSRSPHAVSLASSSWQYRSSASLRAMSPQTSNSPHKYRSPRRSRSPVRSQSPVKSRSPIRSRSPHRSISRSPQRSPPRSHHQVFNRSPNFISRLSSRSPHRSPRRSPRRSPHYLPPRANSPGRLLPLRSRSRSPRLLRSRSRSPGRVSYVRRSRSRTPLSNLRRSISPVRRLSSFRRSHSRSPGGRLYALRRSRSRSPRAPLGPRRSPSPKRRSPLYVKKLSPKRRSISPRKRSISPRRRSVSPRRRSVSPRRKSVSPRRRPLSPSWSRSSPPRNRSPVGLFSQRLLSPRRRSPHGDYPVRRSPSPSSRKYSPPVHRGISPPRNYRSPSPVSRSVVRRRSPAPISGPLRRSPPHRAPSPSYRLSPAKQSRIAGSPGRIREKQRQLSPLPPVLRNTQRLPSPRRQRSPLPYSRGYHNSKVSSPVQRVSPTSNSLKRSTSPLKETPASGRDMSPNDSISLSPSPERQLATKPLDDRNRGRKSHPLPDLSDSKRSRTDLRNVLPRRKDSVKEGEITVATRLDECSKKERRERKRIKREKRREAQQDSSNVLEARRRKFESGTPTEVSPKKIRLRNMAAEATEPEEQEEDSKDMEVNIEKEKERELKEVNEVDESILDRELMGGVDLLWSDEEEEEIVETSPPVNGVQFKRTFNVPSTSCSSGKENIPEDTSDSRKEDDKEPTSTTESPKSNILREDDSDLEVGELDAVSESSGEEHKAEEEPQEAWPKTNRELKEYILSQAKGSGALVRFPKAVKEFQTKSKANDSDDLRDELSRRRAERLTKVNSYPETLPGRLLQSALQGVGVKSRREKSHRRRARSPLEDDLDQPEGDGRRVLVLRRAAEQKQPAINITISKVESSKESSSTKMGGKLPIHLRLGTGKKGDDSPKKVKLKRNTTVGRRKQVLWYFDYILCLIRFMVLLHACGLEQPILYGKLWIQCRLTDKQATLFRIIQYFPVNISVEMYCYS